VAEFLHLWPNHRVHIYATVVATNLKFGAYIDYKKYCPRSTKLPGTSHVK